VTASTSGVTGVADPPTYDNFVDLVHTIDPEYRKNSRFMMSDSTLKSIKKIKILQYSGDTVGVPLWQPGLAAQSDSILGYPYVINQSMAAPGSSAKKVLFGDFSKYIIRDVGLHASPPRRTVRRATTRSAFLAFSRSDGDLLDAGTHPVKYMG
jgi:HK97 family phage major capsid protein